MNTPAITTAAPQAGNATRATPHAGPHAEPAVPGNAGNAGRAASSAKSRRSIDPHAGNAHPPAGGADVGAQDVDPAATASPGLHATAPPTAADPHRAAAPTAGAGLPATASAAPLYLGIDVAKAELVAATRADGRVLHTRAYANNAAGIRKLLRHAAKDAGGRPVRACLESTGAYHWAAAEALFDAHGAVAVAPPAAVRDFMRSTMRRNKTDAADAAAIAEFAERMNPRQWRPRREAQEMLRQMSVAHDALVRQRGDAQRRLQSGACAHVADTWRRMEAYLNAEMAGLRAAMEAHIAADKKLAQDARLLRSIPGIGAGSAATALGVIDFAQFDSADQLAAYIGVCPSRKQSGPSAGRARISKQGQALLRRQLYMAALAAVRHNPPIQHAAARWQSAHTKGNGRPLTPKQTVCAAMHKLVRQMFGVVKRGQPYQADWRSRRAPTNHSAANTAPATAKATADANAGTAANANQPAADAAAGADANASAAANAGADAAAGQPAAATDTSSPAHPIAA